MPAASSDFATSAVGSDRSRAPASKVAAAVAADCGLALADLSRFYDLAAATPRMVTLFSMGVNQSAHGVDKGLAIINAHLVTGRIGKPGAAPFSITGQPNAMGGRETGGMATTILNTMNRELPLSFIDEFGNKVNAITVADVNNSIKKHLDPEKMVLVKAGTVAGAMPDAPKK